MRMLIIVAVLARASVAAADIADVDTFEGRFDGKTHLDEPGGGADERTLTNGTMTLKRNGATWEGEVKAHLVVKMVLSQSGMTTSGEGDVTGTVKLELRAGGRYRIQWRTSEIAGVMKLKGVPDQPIKLAFDGGGSFVGNGAVTTSQTDIKATDEHTDPHNYRRIHWELDGQGLIAIPNVSPTERGQKSHLDGTASTPRDKITRYHWKLEPGGDCPTPHPAAREFDGAKLDVTLLCTMNVTLVVSDGTKQSQPAATTATITPRRWKTTFEPPAAVATIPGQGLVSNHSLFGENVCAIEGPTAPPAGHVFHHHATYKDDGYTIATVHEPNSPFDGWAYIKTYSVKYQRRSRYNRELDATSETGIANARHHRADLALVRDCTIKHETVHDEKMRVAIAADDPAPKVEAVIGPRITDVTAEGRVEALANSDIDDVDRSLTASHFLEQEVHHELTTATKYKSCQTSATICIKDPDGVWFARTYNSVAEMGDNGGAANNDSRAAVNDCATK